MSLIDVYTDMDELLKSRAVVFVELELCNGLLISAFREVMFQTDLIFFLDSYFRTTGKPVQYSNGERRTS